MYYSKNSIQTYLKEISNKQYLEHEELYKLGEKITAMKALGVSPSLSKPDLSLYSEEEQEIIREGMQAFVEFAEGNLRLVVSIAKKYNKKSSDFLNLIQLGNLGLIRAIDKFDFSTGYKFSTYAYWWIKQSISRGLTNTGRTIRLPIHINDRLDKINRVIHKLTQKTGRTPSISAIARECKITPEEVQFCLDSDYKVSSLNIPLNTEEGTEIQDLIYDAETFETSELTDKMAEVLEKFLTQRQQDIVRMTFGIRVREHCQKEICITLGISKEILESELETALGILRENCKELKNYF